MREATSAFSPATKVPSTRFFNRDRSEVPNQPRAKQAGACTVGIVLGCTTNCGSGNDDDASDGERFVFFRDPVEGAMKRHVVVVQNWYAEFGTEK